MSSYYERNKEKIKASRKLYYEKNSKKIIFNQSQKVKNRKKSDPLYKLKIALRSRSSALFKQKGLTKNKKTEEILGVPFDIAKKHIESKFKKGMNWGNYGKHGDVWQIDHIIPLSSAKTEDELIKLCHYTNLQMRNGTKHVLAIFIFI